MERLIKDCKRLLKEKKYQECEKLLAQAMLEEPHSAIPHNLMGILMECENKHVIAMKHFRASYSLDPSYQPARYNLEYDDGRGSGPYAREHYAFTKADCTRKQVNYRTFCSMI